MSPLPAVLVLALLLSLHATFADGSKVAAQGERRFERADPVQSRLFLASTGRAVKRGVVNLAAYELFFPFVQVGMGGGASIGGGVSMAPEAPGELFYFGGKLAFYQRPTTNIAAGVTLAANMGLDDPADQGMAGLGGVTATFGNAEKALTVALSVGATDDGEFGFGALILGGELQVSNSVKLLAENWIVPGVNENSVTESSIASEFFLALGTRFFGDRIAVDLAAIISPEISEELGLPAAPWLGLSYRIN